MIDSNLDFDRGKTLLNLIGTFWSLHYGGKGEARAYCEAVGHAAMQLYQDLRESIDALGRQTVPIFHVERWFMLSLKQSAGSGFGQVRFDDPDHPRIFDDTFYFDRPVDFDEFAYPAAGMADCRAIFNRIEDPSRTFIAGVDFTLDRDRDAIIFRSDPFADDLLASRPVFDADGNEIDREIVVWAYRAEFDREYIYYHFGHPVGVHMPSSRRYKDFINAIWDSATNGTSVANLETALSSIADVDLAKSDGETVLEIAQDARHLLVITDRNAYTFNKSARPVVTVGQGLAKGDPIVDALVVADLNRGEPPAWVGDLYVDPGFMGGEFMSDLVFEDREVPLAVQEDWDGRTRVEFHVAGFPADVEEFWRRTHEKGVATGNTLAHALDHRPDNMVEPSAAALPTTINPMRFLVANVFRGNAIVAKLRAGSFGEEALGAGYLGLLRKLIPPHGALLSTVEMPALVESVRLVDVGQTTQQLSLAESVPAYGSDGPTNLRVIAEAC